MSRKAHRHHEVDPVLTYGEVIETVRKEFPFKGPQAQLARLIGVTRAQVHLWSIREDGRIPAPWCWRIPAVFEQLGYSRVEQSTTEMPNESAAA